MSDSDNTHTLPNIVLALTAVHAMTV